MWPDRATLRASEPLNVVFDGNSLLALKQAGGIGSSYGGSTSEQATALLARRFTALTTVYCGIGGQTWRQMDGLDGGSSADVDNGYLGGCTNVLVVWETTNAVFLAGRSAAQVVGDAQSYVANRLARHPDWRILLLSTLPRQGGSSIGTDPASIAAGNVLMASIDGAIAGACRAWGCRGWIDVRGTGSPFRFVDYAPASFAANDDLWNDAVGGRLHLRDAGYAIVAGLVARAIANMAAR